MRKDWTRSTTVGNCLVLAAIWGMLAFPGSALADPPPHNHGGGDGGDGAAPLCVTLADFLDPSDPSTATNLRDDRLGEYCPAEAGVSVSLEESFNLRIDPKKAERHLELEIPTCIGTGGTCLVEDVLRVATWNLREYVVDNFGVFTQLSNELDFQSMPVGEEHFTGLRINFPSGSKSTPHQVLFGALGDHDCVADEGGTPVSVVRDPSDTWTITAASPVDQACLMEVQEKNQRYVLEVFSMWFKLVIAPKEP